MKPPQLSRSLAIFITLTLITLSTSVFASPIIHKIQQSSQTAIWQCNSLQSPQVFSESNCALSSSCSLRTVQCMIDNTTTQSYDLTKDESVCEATSPKPVRISADCSENLACTSLQCVPDQGICTFDQTHTNQPWFCLCQKGWQGDQCNTCSGTLTPNISSSESNSTTQTHTECSSNGQMTSKIEQTFNPSENTISTISPPSCACTCSSYRSSTTFPVPLYFGNDCSCKAIYLGVKFPSQTALQLFPSISLENSTNTPQLPTPTLQTSLIKLSTEQLHLQLQLQLIIDDMQLPTSQLPIIPSSTSTTSSPTSTYLQTYISTTNLQNFNTILEVFLPIQICPQSSSNLTIQQTPLDEAQLQALFDAYSQNPNAIIYNPNLFPQPPTLSFYNPPASTTTPSDSPDSPFNTPKTIDDTQGGTDNNSSRPDTWHYDTYDTVSGVLSCILFVVAYTLVHNLVLRWFQKTYIPKDDEQTMDRFEQTYKKMLHDAFEIKMAEAKEKSAKWELERQEHIRKLQQERQLQQYYGYSTKSYATSSSRSIQSSSSRIPQYQHRYANSHYQNQSVGHPSSVQNLDAKSAMHIHPHQIRDYNGPYNSETLSPKAPPGTRSNVTILSRYHSDNNDDDTTSISKFSESGHKYANPPDFPAPALPSNSNSSLSDAGNDESTTDSSDVDETTSISSYHSRKSSKSHRNPKTSSSKDKSVTFNGKGNTPVALATRPINNNNNNNNNNENTLTNHKPTQSSQNNNFSSSFSPQYSNNSPQHCNDLPVHLIAQHSHQRTQLQRQQQQASRQNHVNNNNNNNNINPTLTTTFATTTTTNNNPQSNLFTPSLQLSPSSHQQRLDAIRVIQANSPTSHPASPSQRAHNNLAFNPNIVPPSAFQSLPPPQQPQQQLPQQLQQSLTRISSTSSDKNNNLRYINSTSFDQILADGPTDSIARNASIGESAFLTPNTSEADCESNSPNEVVNQSVLTLPLPSTPNPTTYCNQ